MAINNMEISKVAMRKIRSYTSSIEGEVCGLLYINNDDRRNPIVEDAVVLDQIVTSSSANITEKALVSYLTKLALEKPDDIERVKGWWHSHYDFDVFWSTIDDDTFNNFTKVMPRTYGIVVNKLGDILARTDTVCNGKKGKFIRTQNEIDVIAPRVRTTKGLMEEAKKKVKIRKIIPYMRLPFYGRYHDDDDNYYRISPFPKGKGKDKHMTDEEALEKYYQDEEDKYMKEYQDWKKQGEAKGRKVASSLWGDDDEEGMDFDEAQETLDELFGNTKKDKKFADSYKNRRRKMISGVT